MKERPIIFSAPMVRAILSGTKTQTRRLWKLPRGCDWYAEMGGEREGWFVDHGAPWWLHATECRCPYGVPGDRLWVREAFSGPHSVDGLPPSEWNPCAWNCPIWYWADGNPIQGDWTRPRPSIHMPRWASRILLEVTGVRVERIQDISEADAQAEGIVSRRIGTGDARTGCRDAFGLACDDSVWASSTIQAYGALWESINGPDSWSANPWVWVVEFKRMQEPSK